ncbi:ankyrin repeat-containing domain protein [Chytridium lagenaria]|nr:ankyrin repeat-containing domain protein [Chytridium lagenaria]
MERGGDHMESFGKVLDVAARHGNEEVVEKLLDRVDVTEDDSYAMRCAAEFGRFGVLKLLLERGAKPGARSNHAIMVACRNGWENIVKLLLDWKPIIRHGGVVDSEDEVDPGIGNNFPLRIAASEGHIGVVRLLLRDMRVNPSADRSYALRKASENGFDEVVEVLVRDPRVDPAADDSAALRGAAEMGHVGVIRHLIGTGKVDIKARNWEAIRVAIEKGHVEVVRELVRGWRGPRAIMKMHELDANEDDARFVAEFQTGLGNAMRVVINCTLSDGRRTSMAMHLDTGVVTCTL